MTQKERLTSLFVTRPHEWVSLPEIMEIAAQYNARISELRGPKDANGNWTLMDIRNKLSDNIVAGVKMKNSWYMYIPKEKQMEFN